MTTKKQKPTIRVEQYISSHDETIAAETLSESIKAVAYWPDGKAVVTESGDVLFSPDSCPAFWDANEPCWDDVVAGKYAWGKPSRVEYFGDTTQQY